MTQASIPIDHPFIGTSWLDAETGCEANRTPLRELRGIEALA
jgi:hypothetical protein